MSRRSRLVALVAAASMAPAVAGCGALKLEQLPSPKGVSGPTYHVKAQFADVTNLVVGAKVKLEGVVVGEVTSIGTRDYHANVDMNILKKFPLAAVATFQVRFSTPLGENFISVSSPDKPGQKLLADGDEVGLSQTSDAPGIEDTFAALSVLLNGGGLSKLHIIATELDAALKGRTGAIRDTLTQLHRIIANFNANKADFDKALVSLAKMSKALSSGTSLVDEALTVFPGAIKALAEDTAKVRALLTRVAQLGDTIQGMLNRSQDDMLTFFDQLRPTLDSLRASQGDLIPTFDSLIRFGKLFDQATPGDYLNVDLTVQFLLEATPQRPVPGGSKGAGTGSTTPATSTSAQSVAALLSGGGQ